MSTGLPNFPSAFSTSSEIGLPTMSEANSTCEALGKAVPTTLPLRMIVILSAASWTSRNLWVMKTIDVPLSRKLFIFLNNSSVSCGVKTAVGSSRMRTLAS
ncbi:unannotated protein [freshwater metagenome]|uniref:Unannotated protein n=1 Tax=freshwater metagenome TaxID=449393 RepID=A0A6J7Q865_9ZZZZ